MVSRVRSVIAEPGDLAEVAGPAAAVRVGGLRERKRRETRARIVESALGLFMADGFDATTVEAIARSSDISPRTFFHYFESKDAILWEVETEFDEVFCAALATGPADLAPLDAICEAMITVTAQYESEEAVAFDRLMQSTAALRARKQAQYERKEKALFGVLRQRWPGPAREQEMRLVAMIGIGALRIAVEGWRDHARRRPLPGELRATFSALKTALGTASADPANASDEADAADEAD